MLGALRMIHVLMLGSRSFCGDPISPPTPTWILKQIVLLQGVLPSPLPISPHFLLRLPVACGLVTAAQQQPALVKTHTTSLSPL